MNRSTVGHAAGQKMLESLLQNRLGLKYMQSRKLVAKGRENLGMSTSEPWTTALEAECIKLYEAEHGPVKERDYSTPAAEVATTPPRSFVKPSTTTSTPAKSTVPKLPAKSFDKS